MELSENYQFNYRKLLKFLSRKDSSGYMFAMADDYRFISQINTSLQAELEQNNTSSSIVFLQSNADEPLVEQLKLAGTFAHAIIVANLYEVINSSDGLNQLLLLNFSREELRSIQSPALFWVDARSLNVIANQAPDLFSQRWFTTIHFTGKVEHPLQEALEKPDWQEYITTEKFKETEAKIETLKRRLQDAEESGYNVKRIASEIAIPLAFEYAQLGFAEKAEVLLTKYKSLLDNTNSKQLKQLAKVYYQLHQYPVAVETLKKANEIIVSNLSKEAKDTVYPSEWFHNIIDISDWMEEYGLPTDAINLLTKAETLLLENIGQFPVDTLDSLIALFKERLGDLHLTLGNFEKAKYYFEQGLIIALQLEKTNPHSEQLKRDLSISFNKLGDIAQQLGTLQHAQDYFEQSLAIRQQLEKTNPHSEQLKRDLSISYDRLGDISQQLGNLQQAKDYFERGLVIRLQLEKINPHSEQLKRDLSVSYEKLGDVSQQLGNLQQAKDYFKQSLAIRLQLKKTNFHSEQLKRDLSVSYDRLGGISQQLGNLQQAKDYFEQSLAIAQQLEKINPNSEQLKRDLAVSLSKLGKSNELEGNMALALKHYQDAKKLVNTLYNANSLSQQLKDDVAEMDKEIVRLQDLINKQVT